MQTFNTVNSTAYNITISGPLEPYSYTLNTSFSDEYNLVVNATFSSPMQGDDLDLFKITFVSSMFKSKYEATLITSELK